MPDDLEEMEGPQVTAIAITGLHKSYGGLEVLRGVDLNVRRGEFYALMGQNGSGKTTLISILTCNSRPAKGTASVQGHDAVNEAYEVKKRIGYVPQENFSCSTLTGMENLVFFARLFGFPRGEAEALAGELAKKMELQDHSGKRVSEYSGGMRKRLEVATVLLPGADVLFLDEPTTGLDPSARKDFLRMLKEVNSKGVTVFMVTHIGEDAEAASRVGFMDDGRIMLEGDPEELKNGSGLRNVIEVETPRKGEDVESILMAFSSERELQETDEGYRVFCEEPEEALPAIVRALDGIGCRAGRLEIRAPSLEDVFFKVTRKPLRS
jgi:ABC-type multidrug transport system ATPase subunit